MSGTVSIELPHREIEEKRSIQSDASSVRYLKSVLAVLSIVAISVVTYLPAINNSFISDDFTLLSLLKVLDQYPMYIVQATSELFRSVTYVYFWTCFKLFGVEPELYYWSSIALHAVVSLLVYMLVRIVTRQPLAGLVAAMFFAAYERHQEAVMWVSAANEIILTLNCVLFLILWERVISRARLRRTNFTLALLVFALALFSKEAAVALVPLAMLGLIRRGYYFSEAFRRCWPLVMMVVMYGAFWLSQADRNFFVTQGHYAFGLQFFPVYAHSSFRLLSQSLPFLAAFVAVRVRSTDSRVRSGAVLSDPSLFFFAAMVLLSIAPYSFLTYLDHIPSRNAYFPSIGLAGINGILFAAMFDALSSIRAKLLSVTFLTVVIGANVAYVWFKKDPQYVERAAPTQALIQVLNASDFRSANRFPINVCGFPLHPWIGEEAVKGFTPFSSKEVVFSQTCADVGGHIVLTWNPQSASYTESVP